MKLAMTAKIMCEVGSRLACQ